MDGRWDVVIVGAGPAGLAAGIYAGRARRSTLLLERGVPGGQILLTDWVENYPGFPDGVTGFDLMQSFRRHAEKFGAKIDSDEIKGVVRAGDIWRLQGAHRTYDARAVIVATGSAYRRLGLADEVRLTGRGVSYCATCDGAFFSGLDVAVVGGGDNAMKESIFLTKYARSVTIIHRRDRFRGEKIYQERVLADPKIKVFWETVVEAVRGGDKVEGLSLKDLKTGAVSTLDIQGLFVSIGTEPKAEFLRGLLDLNEWGQVKVNLDQESSVSGIFAAGDVSDACPKQIATAVGTGVHAALSVEEYLSKR
ncbi:MAG TPA: thioredoxin-disulfide reductase [Acidobacteriota bacterium]|nr:thioredoxin-disulfide reductase [Acidobacteriota bacterium]